MIYLTSDHGGLELKNKILHHLRERGLEVVDEGPYEYLPEDDYPDYVIPIMYKLQNDPESKAIVVCRNGAGVSITANKFDGVRAVISWNQEHARSTRNDDNANVLALPASYISEVEAKQIADAWLEAPFSNEDRHSRRIEKIINFEKSRSEEKK
jgi:ribose 5-phosphate isomerase B